MRAAALLTALFLLAGCTGRPPEILRTAWELTLVQDRESGNLRQSLSLLLKPSDPDGIEDLEELYLINDQEELLWRLDSESWLESGSGEDLWIGSNDLRLPDGSPLPAGEYRILLRDVGGDSVEQTIFLQKISTEELRRYLPQVTVKDGEIRVKGAAPSYLLWLYSSEGSHTGTLTLQEGRVEVQRVYASFPNLQAGFRFKVYARIPGRMASVISGPYYVSP